MGASVVDGVESRIQVRRLARGVAPPSVRVQLLGPLSISRDGAPVALPASRKVRALAAYLTLAPRALGRAHLCEMLWDVPNDPRGELRWCLSKVRSVLDEPDRRRVQTASDAISLDLSDCFVDVVEISEATQSDIAQLSPERLRALAELFVGDFLEGLELERSAQFNAWLVAQRRRFRACHTAILEQLVKGLPAQSEEVFAHLEKWLELAPLDRRAHEILLNALASHGRLREGAEHLAATARVFEAEGLDYAPIRAAWRAATSPHQSAADPAKESAARRVDVVVEHAAGAIIIAPGAGESTAVASPRASIAVMPLIDLAAVSSKPVGLAGALVHDVITRLAKLRSLAVIAQGTVFALSERGVGAEAAGRMLNVDYVASGSVREHKNRIIVMIELAETRTARIVWAEDFDYTLDDAFTVLDEIGNRIVAAMASEIEAAERNRALLKPPSSLNAWEAHHRGLWHMYRFNAADNELAHHFFQTAVRLDPTFSRAHAGLSFTHFQNAFLHRTADREQEIDRAFATAGQALIADDRDPAAHWAMGRALWLRGRQEASLVELERAVELSPNFALGHYTLSFVHSQSGDPQAAIVASDYSRHLSPFDPLLFAMLASRALAHLRMGQFDEAATWAVSAASRPTAHVHIRAIAAHCLAAASRLEEARALVAAIHKTNPQYRIDDYLGAFHFAPDAAALFRKAARLIGIG